MTFEEATSYLPKDVKTVEAAQSELRMLARDAALKGISRDALKEAAQKVIKKHLDRIESEEIKLRAKEALPKFVGTIFNQMLALVMTAHIAASFLRPKTPQAARRLKAVLNRTSEEEMLSILDDENAYNIEVNDRAYFEAYNRKVRSMLNSILHAQARPQYGSHVNLRNIAEMTVRYDRQKAHLENIRRSGQRLVWIEPHANCSKRCEPWQGRLYSLDGTSGKADGISYIPIEAATDQFYTTKTGRTYKNGCITGYNCRHKTIPFDGLQSRPDPIPAHIIAKKRAAEEEQRARERAIRYEREKAAFLRNINPQASAAATLNAKKMLADYERFSVRAGLPRIDGRTEIAPGEGRIVKDIPKILSQYVRPAKPAIP